MLTPEQVSALIDKAGGPSDFGRLLGIDRTDKKGWRQRVHNWRKRGLPWKVVVQHSEAIGKLRRKRQ